MDEVNGLDGNAPQKKPFERLRLIEASAGTGKTQELAERLIELLRLGVEPKDIVALTFSRLAAGEIFERFVTLLAKKAAADAEYAALLRKVVETQHLSQIGTLDGYLLKMVRMFPLELGITGELEMMDDYESAAEASRVSFSILRRTDPEARKAFLSAFTLALDSRNARSFTGDYRSFVKGWHETFLSLPDEGALGEPERIFTKSGHTATAEVADLEADADALENVSNHDKWPQFVEFVRNFRGSFAGLSGLAPKFLACENLFDGPSVEISFSKRKLAFSGRQANAIRNAFYDIFDFVLRQKTELARGVRTLVSAYEREYAAKVRNAGRLVFADLPRLVAKLKYEERSALEYRMDSKVKAWAVDEFQDTSREQWNAVGNLIDEAKQDGERSVFIVGDCKQAIYGWRNGDVGIFRREKDSGCYAAETRDASWRYGPAIAEAITSIFRGGLAGQNFPQWSCPAHMSMKPDMECFVQRVDAGGPAQEDFIAPLANAIKAVDPVRRGISAAILVRGNTFGELIASRLKAAGVEGVVWEGESAILDTPALLAFLDLVSLSDHPGDRQAYAHFKTTPLAAAKYPQGVPDPAAISAEFAREFTKRGFVRTFRDLRALLPADPREAWSDFTEARFTDMLRAASDFELSMKPSTRRSDFAAYLESRKKRNVAEPGKIRVLTIHRSKGLGFDWVLVPVYEKNGLVKPPAGPLKGDGWAFPDPGKYVASGVEELSGPWNARADSGALEELCIYYVALTRAKRAMTLVLHPEPSGPSKTLRFSTIVRSSIQPETGVRDWYERFTPEKGGAGAGSAAPFAFGAEGRGKRVKLRRRLPSKLFQDGMSAGELFVSGAGRAAAKRRGTEEHRRMEEVEWIDAGAASNNLERELVKPDGLVELWRERSYELALDGQWESGQIDRAVFARDADGTLRATVYDYKTNRMMRGESADAFRARIAEKYSGQLHAYRRAVAALTGIPAARIGMKILLLATGEALAVD